MSHPVRHSVSLCLLVTWSVTSLLAMVWHPHDHEHTDCCYGVECSEERESSTGIAHQHSHTHGCGHSHAHDGHHHSHESSDRDSKGDSAPHSPDTCPSCQLLAISVIVPHRVEIPQFDLLVASHPIALQSLLERDLQTTLKLRGPPVTSMT